MIVRKNWKCDSLWRFQIQWFNEPGWKSKNWSKTDIYQSVDICCNVYWNQFFIMIFTVGYVHEITYLIIVLIALGIILRDWLKLKGKSRVIRGEYQKKDEWSIFSGQVKLRILQYIVIKVNYMSECRME